VSGSVGDGEKVLVNALDCSGFSMSTGSVLADDDDDDSVTDVTVGGMSTLVSLPSILREQQKY